MAKKTDVIELIKEKVRPYGPGDRDLPTFSYSKLEVFKNCRYQYDFKYNQGMRSSDTTLALELGSLLHYVMEQKGKMLVTAGEVDYEILNRITQRGVFETDEKTQETLLGVKELKQKYWDTWYEPDNASGMNYDEKLEVFDKVLHSEMENEEWKPYLFEHPFKFVWDDKLVIHGFIDRIDKRGEDLRTIDYKTSKKSYDKSKLVTSLQFGIYALAIFSEFGVLPVESLYRFILIDETQKALSLGWEKRLIKALDKIFNQIEECEETGIWVPKPTPLCHWCYMCKTNPNAGEYKNYCRFYSLWTPDNKTFAVNEEWNGNTGVVNKEGKKRVLVF